MNAQHAIDVLETLVAFDTTSRNSNLPLIEWVEAYLDKHGIAHERIPDDTGKKTNLWATIGPKDVPGYILSGHTDVVPVDGQDWATDPFKLTRKGDKLYGRGSTDMKGFVACVIAAVPEMVKRDLKAPFHLAFSYDEEVGCLGAQRLGAFVEKLSVKPIACFVGEPTTLDVVIGHKSKRSFVVKLRGRNCHSSLAPQGVNAVEFGARVISKVRDIADRLTKIGPRDPLYDVPFSTAHTGFFHGGTVLNLVAEESHFEFEFRTIAADDLEALTDEVTSYARDTLEPQMKAVDPKTGIDIHIRSSIPGLDTDAEADVIALAKKLAGRNAHSKVAYCTEAGLFQEAGVPSVVIGPGSIDQAHKVDEFITVGEIEKCCAFLDKLMAHAAK
ncbi:MAG: acetylornithine deacetylase [Variibacter sp.]